MLPALLVALALNPPQAATICIDPGHPSEVGRGTRGKKVTELHTAWEVARRMQAILQKRGVKVVMTKTAEEQFVRNRDRSAIANRHRADLMVRLHCDAASGSGFTTYFPDRQGRSGKTVGPSRAMIRATGPIARRFHAAFGQAMRGTPLRNNGLKSDSKTFIGSKQGALTGSIFSQVPVVLVEMCVLTNPKDEAFIATPRGRQRMADALAFAAMQAVQVTAK